MKVFVKNRLYLFYIVLLTFVGIVLLFTNVGYDSEYQLAMAYRLLKGDALITQMWEPHQTSAFLCALLMKVYISLTGTATGIVLYTQICGIVIRIAISILMYKSFRKYTDNPPALIASVLFFLISPKDILTPEFSNMQLWFSTLMFLFFVKYFETDKIRFLILTAICLCLGVLSYPSFILAYIFTVFIIYKNSHNIFRDFLIFTGVCAFIGISFITFILTGTDVNTLIYCVSSALSLEPTHIVSTSDKIWEHIRGMGEILTVLAIICLAAIAMDVFFYRLLKKKLCRSSNPGKGLWKILAWYILLGLFFFNILSAENRNAYSYLLLFIIFLGISNRKLLSQEGNKIYLMALLIGVSDIIATLLLSDHGFIQAVPYGLLAVCASALPIYRWSIQLSQSTGLKKMTAFAVHAFILLLIFRCFYIHVPLYGRGQIISIFNDSSFVRSGPALGLYTNDEGVVRQRDSYREWEQYIHDGDRIWILDEPVDTLGYMYNINTEVAAPTVMSTPSYNEALLEYWKLNPDKYPDVVILAASDDELSYDILKNSWLLEWLNESYQPETVIYGTYWCYCFKEERSLE